MPDALIDILDSGRLRDIGYGVVAVHAIWIGLSERRRNRNGDRSLWPTYWFVSAIVLLTIGVITATEYDDVLSQMGRDRAWSGGWYRSRRFRQSIVVAVAAGVCGIGVLVAMWRMPRPRRRYLPHLLAVSSLVGVLAVRIVSLHNVDVVLYRRDIAGIRIVAITELTLLTIAWFAGAYGLKR